MWDNWRHPPVELGGRYELLQPPAVPADLGRCAWEECVRLRHIMPQDLQTSSIGTLLSVHPVSNSQGVGKHGTIDLSPSPLLGEAIAREGFRAEVACSVFRVEDALSRVRSVLPFRRCFRQRHGLLGGVTGVWRQLSFAWPVSSLVSWPIGLPF